MNRPAVSTWIMKSRGEIQQRQTSAPTESLHAWALGAEPRCRHDDGSPARTFYLSNQEGSGAIRLAWLHVVARNYEIGEQLHVGSISHG